MERAGESSIEVSRDGSAITVHVPLSFRRRGGRKLIVSPAGEQPWAPPTPKVDKPLVKALLSEHDTWQNAVNGAIAARVALAETADEDPDYIRPIVLFQAQPKNQEVTVEVLKKHLIEVEQIAERRSQSQPAINASWMGSICSIRTAQSTM
jgi:hypothetical protein